MPFKKKSDLPSVTLATPQPEMPPVPSEASDWRFDQERGVACITCRSVLAGSHVLMVTHYEDDHSWAFLDGEDSDPDSAMVVAMSTVIDLHPELEDISDLPPGWSASRPAVGRQWTTWEDVADEV